MADGPVYLRCSVIIDVNLQEAVAIGFDAERQRLNSPECYHNSVSAELKPKRDKMAKFLQDVGMVHTVPEGGYFMVADFSNFSRFTTAIKYASGVRLLIRLAENILLI